MKFSGTDHRIWLALDSAKARAQTFCDNVQIGISNQNDKSSSDKLIEIY